MADRFDMWHRKHGGRARTTEDAYEALWFPKGWRKSPASAKNAPAPAEVEASNKAGTTAEEE